MMGSALAPDVVQANVFGWRGRWPMPRSVRFGKPLSVGWPSSINTVT
ncbi:hypothetical protein [Nocardia sp. Marseille-Q1738]